MFSEASVFLPGGGVRVFLVPGSFRGVGCLWSHGPSGGAVGYPRGRFPVG